MVKDIIEKQQVVQQQQQLQIEKCPMLSRGQTTLLGGVLKCICGFHTLKPTASNVTGPAQKVVEQPHAAETAKKVMEQSQPDIQPHPLPKPQPTAPVEARVATQFSLTPDPTVPTPVPRATADVSNPAQPCRIVSTAPSGALLQGPSVVQLPRLWSETIPPEDHKWIGKRLFKIGSKGKPALRDDLQLWYYPPQPALIYNQAPAPDRFFCHTLLLWMPYKLWRVKVLCPNPACGQHQLTGGGLHKMARQVLDIDRTYNMVTETLICTKCRASHVSWSQTVLQQLDLGHRSEFQVILTRK
ncbi:uncharacterized protein LOC113099961 [Carassius auratus]|uniref:Uncharacterized protein LOC113099961 n=1 Tax=Carassius auratus TaxID=7957 RepID=A0A6P6PJT2_CARAU|nr:uncharacterized protein LOC113099961 [Carassius auratus]